MAYRYPALEMGGISDMGASVNLANFARQNQQYEDQKQLRQQAIDSMNLYSRGVPGVGYRANAPLSFETAATILGIPYTQKYEAGSGMGGGGYVPEPTPAQIDIQNSQAAIADEQARSARENRQGKLPEMSDAEKIKASGEQKMNELGVQKDINKMKIEASAQQDEKKFQQQKELLKQKLDAQFQIASGKAGDVSLFDQKKYLKYSDYLARLLTTYNTYKERRQMQAIKDEGVDAKYDPSTDPIAASHLQDIEAARNKITELENSISEKQKSKGNKTFSQGSKPKSSQLKQNQTQTQPQFQPVAQNMGFNPLDYNGINPIQPIPNATPYNGPNPMMNLPYYPNVGQEFIPQNLSYLSRGYYGS